MRRTVVLAALLVATGCRDWRATVQPGLADDEPRQTSVEAAPTRIAVGDETATLKARAAYRIRAWVVATDEPDDDLSAVMPVDVSLAWGPVASPAVLNTMSFHLTRRYVSYRYDGKMPLDGRAVMTHLANHHLIPASPELDAYLRSVRTGDLITLEGHLVDVTFAGRTTRTSLTRDDKGNGACEILFVESAELMRP